jgi:hypothetical protein
MKREDRLIAGGVIHVVDGERKGGGAVRHFLQQTVF